jgi:hypothetical protein
MAEMDRRVHLAIYYGLGVAMGAIPYLFPPTMDTLPIALGLILVFGIASVAHRRRSLDPTTPTERNLWLVVWLVSFLGGSILLRGHLPF